MSANRHKYRFCITINAILLIYRRVLTIENSLRTSINQGFVLQSLRNRYIITIITIWGFSDEIRGKRNG